ncbi:hypothetical protein [Aerolutibacter ruishenii]|uniref:Cytochrome oxidase Cu insertion factor (SCO1/SenC/PrrC family) n=1 Tax=Aerolutibacter ruishenii TaxID=686800 RepID=A0A562LGS8_9GAMM|nr:hypothetical protein [Lysobacter ruishenii]TWI06813.1 hypothetical protein IP93_02805 [Lysobacter ruishenii]
MTPDATTVRRNRLMLLAIFAIFFGSLLFAGVLRFSGWRPAGSRNHGELLQPPGDLRAVTPIDKNGQPYAWNPAERTWRIALAPPASCTTSCVELAREIDVVWQLFGKDADKVHVLWIGDVPAGAVRPASLHELQPSGALSRGLPRVNDPQGVPVYVIDPNGFVILRYAPGFDPGGLRADMAKLLKLK